MKRTILLSTVILLLTLLLGVWQSFGAVTAYYELKLRSATTGQLVPGKNVDLYQSGSKVYDLTESTTVPGVYYYSSVAHGVYDVYVDGSLYKSGVSVIAGTAGLYFDNDGQLTTEGHADSSVTGAKLATGAVDVPHLSTATKAYIAQTGGLGDFSGLDSLPAIADDDVFAIQDPDSSAPNTITAARFADYVQAEAGAGDITGVLAGIMLAGGGSSGSVTLNIDFLSGTEATSADTADVIAIQEDGTDNMRYITLENLIKPLTITGETTNNISSSGITHAISLTADDISDGVSKKMLTVYQLALLLSLADGTAGGIPVSDGLNGLVWPEELQWDDVNKRLSINVEDSIAHFAVGHSMAVLAPSGFQIFIADDDSSFGNGNYKMPVAAPDSAGMVLYSTSDSTTGWAEGSGVTTISGVAGLTDSLTALREDIGTGGGASTIAGVTGLSDSLSAHMDLLAAHDDTLTDHMTLLAAYSDSIDALRDDVGTGGGATTIAGVTGLSDSLSAHMDLLAVHDDSISALRGDIGSGTTLGDTINVPYGGLAFSDGYSNIQVNGNYFQVNNTREAGKLTLNAGSMYAIFNQYGVCFDTLANTPPIDIGFWVNYKATFKRGVTIVDSLVLDAGVIDTLETDSNHATVPWVESYVDQEMATANTIAGVTGLADSLSDHLDRIETLEAGGSGTTSSSAGSVVYPGFSIFNCHFPFAGPATRAIGQDQDYLIFDATNPDSVTWTGRISPTFDGSTDTLYANFIWWSPAPDDIVLEVKVDAGANSGGVNWNTVAYDDANTVTVSGTMYKRYYSQLALLNDDTAAGGDFVTILLRRNTAAAADDGSSDFNLLNFWLGKGVNE